MPTSENTKGKILLKFSWEKLWDKKWKKFFFLLWKKRIAEKHHLKGIWGNFGLGQIQQTRDIFMETLVGKLNSSS